MCVWVGAYLSRCSEVEGKLAESRKRFEEKVTTEVVTPLKAFMEIDIKGILVRRVGSSLEGRVPAPGSNHLYAYPPYMEFCSFTHHAQRERRMLAVKRLDLDAHKTSASKAQADDKVQAVSHVTSL